MQIDASVIRVACLDSAVSFWTTVGGMEVVASERGWVEVEHPRTAQRVRLLPEYDYTQAMSIETHDLDHAISEMERLLGATVVSRGRGPHLECAQLEDAAGVRYGICQPVTTATSASLDCGC